MAFIPHWKGLSDSRVKGANITKMMYTKTNIDFFLCFNFRWAFFSVAKLCFAADPIHSSTLLCFCAVTRVCCNKLGWGAAGIRLQ